MEPYRLGEMEQRFAELIWQHAPVGSGRLVELCAAELGWKKSTTYTMLKRLCARGLFVNERGRVRALVSREEFAGLQSEQFVCERFGGSLPQFLAAFTRRRPLSEAEIEQLRQMIENAGGPNLTAGHSAPGGMQDAPNAAQAAPGTQTAAGTEAVSGARNMPGTGSRARSKEE